MYWLTILFSQTLGTALGGFLASSSGLGFMGSALVFAAVLALVAAAYFPRPLDGGGLGWG